MLNVWLLMTVLVFPIYNFTSLAQRDGSLSSIGRQHPKHQDMEISKLFPTSLSAYLFFLLHSYLFRIKLFEKTLIPEASHNISVTAEQLVICYDYVYNYVFSSSAELRIFQNHPRTSYRKVVWLNLKEIAFTSFKYCNATFREMMILPLNNKTF